jgi:hypothetical protein
VDLSDIDQHVRKPAPRSTMSQLWEQLDNEQRDLLTAATGLDGTTEPRPDAAVARWLTSLGHLKVSRDMVSRWVESQRA